MVNVPPYCGVPKLSHQFPVLVVLVVVAAVVTGAIDVLGGITTADVVGGDIAVVDVVVVDVVGVTVDDVVAELQDAKTTDTTIKTANAIQVIPFFILASLFF
jgi:hypothetical protein